MTQQRLTQAERRCTCCGRTEKTGAKDSTRLNIVAISPYVYRRGAQGKGITRNAGRVQICDECLIKALVRGGDPAAKQALWRGFAERLRGCYSALIAESEG